MVLGGRRSPSCAEARSSLRPGASEAAGRPPRARARCRTSTKTDQPFTLGAMLVGQVLDGRYRILREIGQGGMGAVCEAVHLGTDRLVAVKVILNQELARNEQAIERFQREAKAAGRIDTQHIGQVLDTGIDRALDMPYLVMELLNGEDLSQLLKRTGPLAPELALRIAAQACVGLGKAHEAGVVHRDIKPANVFLARRDRGEVVVKLLDFGVAKVKLDTGLGAEEGAKELTRTGFVLGSPLYMSPEQAKGLKTLDGRTDLWSLGITLYRALAGKTPFQQLDTIGQLILAICTQTAPPIQDIAPWVPAEVAALLHRALMPDADARFQSAAAMLDAVTRLLPRDGGFIHEDMLRPVPPELRATVAPRFVPPFVPPSQSSEPIAMAQTVALPEPTLLLDSASSSAPLPSGSVSGAAAPLSSQSPVSAAARSTSVHATSLSGSAAESPTAPPQRSKLPVLGVSLAAVVVVGFAAAAWLLLGRAPAVEPQRTAKPIATETSASPGPAGPGGETRVTPGAATGPAPATSAAAAPDGGGPGDDTVSRMAELRRRFEAGKISKAAYQIERQKILDGM
jgi:eukaryotic-like serine/threonine-protein kinase